jgi:hypothetical protein
MSEGATEVEDKMVEMVWKDIKVKMPRNNKNLKNKRDFWSGEFHTNGMKEIRLKESLISLKKLVLLTLKCYRLINLLEHKAEKVEMVEKKGRVDYLVIQELLKSLGLTPSLYKF